METQDMAVLENNNFVITLSNADGLGKRTMIDHEDYFSEGSSNFEKE